MSDSREELAARLFHETYEELAPSFGYETRKATAVPWENVPENNRRLMIATVARVLAALDAPRESEWQPIETAPIDREILAWGYMHDDGGPHDADGRSFMGEEPQIMVAKWNENYGFISWPGGGSYDGLTHWRPLPDPPKVNTTEGDE